MSAPFLAMRGLEAQRQVRQSGREFPSLSGFGSLGDANDQALRNSVVDVVVNVGDAGRVFFYDARLAQSLKDKLNNSGFRVLAFDASNLGSFGGGGTIRARVQILTDGYANANDAASVVAGAAAYLGYNATGSSGVVVSSGGTQPGTQPGGSGGTLPGGQSGQDYPGGSGTGNENPVVTLWNNLTQSPISMAVVVGGAALLVLVALKK